MHIIILSVLLNLENGVSKGLILVKGLKKFGLDPEALLLAINVPQTQVQVCPKSFHGHYLQGPAKVLSISFRRRQAKAISRHGTPCGRLIGVMCQVPQAKVITALDRLMPLSGGEGILQNILQFVGWYSSTLIRDPTR